MRVSGQSFRIRPWLGLALFGIGIVVGLSATAQVVLEGVERRVLAGDRLNISVQEQPDIPGFARLPGWLN